jgi:EAL and modified HD-GYP domain-containing signal transduction protein
MESHLQADLAEKPAPSVARQPILGPDEQVLGYELFLQGEDEQRLGPDMDNTTCAMVDTLNVIGLDVLCDGRRAFMDCSHQMLQMDHFALLPSGIVAEVQASVPADEAVVAACRRLKQAGYLVALDKFMPNDPRESLVPYADFIKIDIQKVSVQDCDLLVKRYSNGKCRMLAQQVESRTEFTAAKKSGFTHFQGYFFRHTEHLRARHIPADRTTYLRLLQMVSKPEVNFTEIENLIKHEPSLCYRLLRHLNSPLMGLSSVLSIRHAFNLLGEKELVRWIRMASTLAMGQEKCSDLVLASLVRARFCELISEKLNRGRLDLYLMGMLSLMDAILEAPMGVVIEQLPLDSGIKAQLLCGRAGIETPLSGVYDLMVARESGDWEKVTKLSKELDLSIVFIAASYNEAMRWAHQLTGTARAKGTAQ